MILDTSAYSGLQNGEQGMIELMRAASEVSVPLPVIAELRYGFAAGTRSQQNEAILQRFLAQAHINILQPTLRTTELYAELAQYCRRSGRVLSHNDIWIAALAKESDQRLVTYDKDFSALHTAMPDQITIL